MKNRRWLVTLVAVTFGPAAALASPSETDRPPQGSTHSVMHPREASRMAFDVLASPRVLSSRAPSSLRLREQADPEQRLNAYLSAAARRRRGVSRSADPVLHGARDGSLSYEGRGFDAKIDPDGRASFDDKYASSPKKLTLRPGFHANEGQLFITLLVANFAFDTWLDKQLGGGDPFREERHWFLTRTAALREARMAKAWQRIAERGAVALRHRLQRIWGDGQRDVIARKQATFSHWEECADDEVGLLGRAIVEAFVRQRCPAGSDCAFTSEELARFNQGRAGRARFAPYVLSAADQAL